MSEIVKAEVLGAEETSSTDAAGRSTQIPEDSWDYDKTGAQKPPYGLDSLALFIEVNTWHYRCVKAKAVSTAGLGFEFIVPDGIEKPNDKNKEKLRAFFNFPNPEMTWGEILENVLR